MRIEDRITGLRLNDEQVGIFYLGQVGFLFKYKGKYLLIDPYLTDYVDRNFSNDAVKWERLYPAPIEGEALSFADYVFFTHAHGDHMDPDTIRKIHAVNSKAMFITAAPIKGNLLECGIEEERILGIKTDTEIVLDEELGIRFRAVPSAHEELHPDGNGSYYEVGYRIQLGDMSFYHCGDCSVYDGLLERIMDTDVMLLTINGRDYFRNAKDIIGCMNSREALQLAKCAHARLLIPTHFDLYGVNEVNPAYFVDCQQRYAKDLPFKIFLPGEGMVYTGI